MIGEVSLRHAQGALNLTIHAYSYSIKLDIEKKRRSFQNKAGQYKTVFEQIVKDGHGGDVLDNATSGKTQGRVLIIMDKQ